MPAVPGCLRHRQSAPKKAIANASAFRTQSPLIQAAIVSGWRVPRTAGNRELLFAKRFSGVKMEIVELFARVMLTAESLGGPHILPRSEVQKLIAARPRYCVSSPTGGFEAPITAESARDRVTFTQPAFQEEAIRRDRAAR
jgi:hypothetical protein